MTRLPVDSDSHTSVNVVLHWGALPPRQKEQKELTPAKESDAKKDAAPKKKEVPKKVLLLMPWILSARVTRSGGAKKTGGDMEGWFQDGSGFREFGFRARRGAGP